MGRFIYQTFTIWCNAGGCDRKKEITTEKIGHAYRKVKDAGWYLSPDRDFCPGHASLAGRSDATAHHEGGSDG